MGGGILFWIRALLLGIFYTYSSNSLKFKTKAKNSFWLRPLTTRYWDQNCRSTYNRETKKAVKYKYILRGLNKECYRSHVC